MVAAYLFSAFFWLAASVRAEVAGPAGGVGSANLANAIAASLAAAGTTAGIDHGWDRLWGTPPVFTAAASQCNCPSPKH